jgi:hypothetical protein
MLQMDWDRWIEMRYNFNCARQAYCTRPVIHRHLFLGHRALFSRPQPEMAHPAAPISWDQEVLKR